MRSKSRMEGKRVGFLAVILAVFSLSGTPAMAQSAATGAVSGLVTDPQAAVIASAVVKLIDLSTGVVRATITNDAGRYDFFNVSPGSYNVTAESPGF